MTTKQPKDFTTTVSLSYDEAFMIQKSLIEHERLLDQLLQDYERGRPMDFPCAILGIPYDNIDDVNSTLEKFNTLMKKIENIGELLHAKELARELEAKRKELNQ